MRSTLIATSLVLGALAFASQDPPEKKVDPAPPAAGQPAPSFRLNDHDGRAVELGHTSGAEGWSVVAIYPKAAPPR